MNFKITCLVFIFFTPVHPERVQRVEGYIAKAFHHIGAVQDNVNFYFKTKPKLILIAKNERPESILGCEEVYLLKDVKISKDVKPAIDRINNFKHPFYRFRILPCNDGVKIVILYNPEFIAKIDPLFFDAISLFKGVMFYILHKDVTKHTNYNKVTVKSTRPIIILDPGHGGQDSGGVGLRKLAEKDVVLSVSQKLKKLLEEAKVDVILTRETDDFVELDDRTTFANFSSDNTIFISIHANWSVNPKASGLETYFADYSLLRNYDNSCFADSFGAKLSSKSQDLAYAVHDQIFKEIHKKYAAFPDRKVRKSISQILIGTEKPSILIELGYLSNEKDNTILASSADQDILAKGIFKGIKKYLKNLPFVALAK